MHARYYPLVFPLRLSGGEITLICLGVKFVLGEISTTELTQFDFEIIRF